MYVFTYAFGDVTMAAVMLTACQRHGPGGDVRVRAHRPQGGHPRHRTWPASGHRPACSMVCLLPGGRDGRNGVHRVHLRRIYFGMNFMNGTMMGMQSNAIAYGEWRDGKTAKAFIMSTFQWCPKIANAVAGAADRLRPGRHRLRVAAWRRRPSSLRAWSNIICLIPAVCVRRRVRGVLLRLPPELRRRWSRSPADLAAREAAKKGGGPASRAASRRPRCEPGGPRRAGRLRDGRSRRGFPSRPTLGPRQKARLRTAPLRLPTEKRTHHVLQTCCHQHGQDVSRLRGDQRLQSNESVRPVRRDAAERPAHRGHARRARCPGERLPRRRPRVPPARRGHRPPRRPRERRERRAPRKGRAQSRELVSRRGCTGRHRTGPSVRPRGKKGSGDGSAHA